MNLRDIAQIQSILMVAKLDRNRDCLVHLMVDTSQSLKTAEIAEFKNVNIFTGDIPILLLQLELLPYARSKMQHLFSEEILLHIVFIGS